jgi:hypothetical protein
MPNHDDLEAFSIQWVSLDEVRRALGDGRVGLMSYAVCIALALVAVASSKT